MLASALFVSLSVKIKQLISMLKETSKKAAVVFIWSIDSVSLPTYKLTTNEVTTASSNNNNSKQLLKESETTTRDDT